MSKGTEGREAGRGWKTCLHRVDNRAVIAGEEGKSAGLRVSRTCKGEGNFQGQDYVAEFLTQRLIL